MDKPIPNNIHSNLRKYRKARGLTQRDVAKVLGLKNTNMISRWENGVCLPNTINTFRLSILYRTMLDALFIDHLRFMKDDLLIREEKILNANYAGK